MVINALESKLLQFFFFLFNVFYNIGQIEANGFLHQARGFQKSLAEENTFSFFFCGGTKWGFLLHPFQTPSAAPQSDVKAAKKTVRTTLWVFFMTVVKLLNIFN